MFFLADTTGSLLSDLEAHHAIRLDERSREGHLMTVVDTNLVHFGDDRRSALVEQIEHSIDPLNDGSPTEVLPEPAEVVKKRFGRDREVLTEFSATFSFVGRGRSHPDGPIEGHLMWMAPEPIDESGFRRRLEERAVDLPPGWSLDFDTMPGSAYAIAQDARDTPPEVIADLLLDVLLALGAPLPTGRWRTYSSSLRY